MSVAKYKTLIGHKVASAIKKSCSNIEINPETISSVLNVCTNKQENTLQIQLPLKQLQHEYKDFKFESFYKHLDFKQNTAIQNVSNKNNSVNDPFVVFDINNDYLIRDVLDNYEYFSDLRTPKCDKSKPKKKVVIEFSSPNIAKPFHFGNFRSTIIGNYLSNLYEHLSHDVLRLTYLGDWGTQFGLLQVGLEKLSVSDEDISKKPIESLFKAYVNAYKESEQDTTILSRAKEIFNSMEYGGNEEVLRKWKMIREFTTKELKGTYERIGVEFDGYEWESNYPANHCASTLQLLEDQNHLIFEDGRKVFKTKSNSTVTLLKSDGSSLYITRDILAAIDRQNRYKFDEMLYVTDFSQQEHFVALDQILCALDNTWERKIKHIKFGRIRGMSTRKGEVVFLKDILDEAKQIMEEKQQVSPSMW